MELLSTVFTGELLVDVFKLFVVISIELGLIDFLKEQSVLHPVILELPLCQGFIMELRRTTDYFHLIFHH